MIVVDASAIAEALTAGVVSSTLLDALDDDLHAPSHLDIEVWSVIRALTLGHKLSPVQAEEALDVFTSLPVTRHDLPPFARQVWQLRHQLTSYDAAYVVLAEALDAPLLTCDNKLASHAHSARVILAPRG